MPGYWGRVSVSPPHPSIKQRGRGKGGVNLPTALLIAHMPGHQEPAVTVETISTPPSPSLHGVGLRRGMKHPPPIFLCYLSLFVSPLLHLSLLPTSPLLSPIPHLISAFPSTSLSSQLYPPSLPISLFLPLLIFLPLFLHHPFCPSPPPLSPLFSAPLYVCIFSSVVGKEEGWAFLRALRTKSRGPRQMGPKRGADTQRRSVCRIWG